MTLEDYRARVRMYHGQLPAFTNYLYYDSQEFHIQFGSHVMNQSMLPILVKELCLVYALRLEVESAVSILKPPLHFLLPKDMHLISVRYVFFSGYGNRGHWVKENVWYIEDWFKEHMPGVDPWGE